MMRLKRVGDPVPSPDGKWVLFAAVDVDLAANKKTSHIWIVPSAGGEERMLIADQDGDRPRWAPDGKGFAFVSTKTAWVADMGCQSLTPANGSAIAGYGIGGLTSRRRLSGELWSPDNKHIFFTSRYLSRVRRRIQR
jgi:Tol biopolymer transport system component